MILKVNFCEVSSKYLIYGFLNKKGESIMINKINGVSTQAPTFKGSVVNLLAEPLDIAKAFHISPSTAENFVKKLGEEAKIAAKLIPEDDIIVLQAKNLYSETQNISYKFYELKNVEDNMKNYEWGGTISEGRPDKFNKLIDQLVEFAKEFFVRE